MLIFHYLVYTDGFRKSNAIGDVVTVKHGQSVEVTNINAQMIEFFGYSTDDSVAPWTSEGKCLY